MPRITRVIRRIFIVVILRAVVDDIVIGCLYLPNGNPAPGPKFDYKLAWFERLRKHMLLNFLNQICPWC
jgi:exonuclease III